VVKKILLGLLAAVLLLVGGALGAAAIWAYSTFGSNGLMSFSAGTITPGPQAKSLLLDVDRFGATVPYLQDYGTTTLSASTLQSGDPTQTLFLGAAPTPDVDAFVKGSPYAVAVRQGDSWTTRDVPGLAPPGLPTEQTFWLASGLGPRPSITVPTQRPLTLLIMHPSGLPTGPVAITIDFTVRNASTWIAGLAIASAGCLLLGIATLILLGRIRSHRGRHQGELPADG
jgi:asparagine N-glycosylation enzyme membrane subunit Stt3